MIDPTDPFASLKDYLLLRYSFSDETLSLIFNHFRMKVTPKNEVLLPAGEICRHFYFVSKGCIRLFYTQPDGSEATRYFALENSFGTGLQSFLTQEGSLETAQVIEPSELLVIGRDDFYHLYDTVPGWDMVYRYIIETAYIVNTRRIETFLCLDAADRYRWLLRTNPALVKRFSNKHIASYLGISQETLSRLKSRL